MRQGLRVDGQLATEETGWEWVLGKVVLDHTGELKNGVSLEVVARPQQLLFWPSDDEGGRFSLPRWNMSTEVNLRHPATR